MSPDATEVKYLRDYKLLVTFATGETKLFDLQPYLNYPVYRPLENEAFCQKVSIQYGTVTWNDEIDIDPDRLYLESVPLPAAHISADK